MRRLVLFLVATLSFALALTAGPERAHADAQVEGAERAAARDLFKQGDALRVAMPLDPGTHTVALSAPGYASAEQTVLLEERDARAVSFNLKPFPALPASSPAAPLLSPAPALAPPQVNSASSPAAAPSPPLPPTQTAPPDALPTRRRGRGAWIVGAHLGAEGLTGSLPADGGATLDANQVASTGVAYGLDGGLRFNRLWYVGLTVEHANYPSGSRNAAEVSSTDTNANATLVEAVIALVSSPEHVSFYGEAGLGARWFTYTDSANAAKTYNGAEFSLGAGVWIPAGRWVRLLPKASVGLGAFPNRERSTEPMPGHAFFALTLTGFFSSDF